MDKKENSQTNNSNVSTTIDNFVSDFSMPTKTNDLITFNSSFDKEYSFLIDAYSTLINFAMSTGNYQITNSLMSKYQELINKKTKKNSLVEKKSFLNPNQYEIDSTDSVNKTSCLYLNNGDDKLINNYSNLMSIANYSDFKPTYNGGK